MAEPWDQLPNESSEAYSRFLCYRNIGPRRSLMRAYVNYLRTYDEYTGGSKRLHVPGSWLVNSTSNFWCERAAAWDIRNLTMYGAKVAVLHVRAVTILAQKTVRHARKMAPGDDGWDDLLKTFDAVAKFLTPEIVSGIQERFKPAKSVVSAHTAGGDKRSEQPLHPDE